MKLQHYLGGLENLGPVSVEKNVFVAEWEKRIFGIHTVMMAESRHLTDALPKYPVDQLNATFEEVWTWASLRTGAESMQPFEYFKYRYYEKWLMGITQFFIARGYVSADEVKQLTAAYRAAPNDPLPKNPNPALKQQILRYLNEGDSGRRPVARQPLFAVGQTVHIADPVAVEHTRLPGFLRNKKGVVTEVYPGAYAYFVSTGPDGVGPAQHVYCVAFDAADIWGADKSEPNTLIYADLFEAYVKAQN